MGITANRDKRATLQAEEKCALAWREGAFRAHFCESRIALFYLRLAISKRFLIKKCQNFAKNGAVIACGKRPIAMSAQRKSPIFDPVFGDRKRRSIFATSVRKSNLFATCDFGPTPSRRFDFRPMLVRGIHIEMNWV